MSEGRAYSATLAKDLLRVDVGGVSYALEVSRIREVVNPLPIIDLPNEREFILGVSEYRDEVVPVVDLRRLFGLPSEPPTRRTKWVILEAGGRLVGAVVDAVLDVFSSVANPHRTLPELDEHQRQRGIALAYRYGGHLVFLLEADRLVEPGLRVPADELSLLPSEAP